MPHLRRGHGRRGATLLVTVLVATVAASIVVVMMQLALFSLGSDVRASAFESAEASSRVLREEVAATLAQDPLAIFSTVLESELPRVCLPRSVRSEPGSVIAPGSAWPAECGFSWGYAPRDPSDPQHGSGVLLSPPSPARSNFVVDVVSTSGEVTVAVRDTFSLGGLSRPRAYSAASLNLDALGSAAVAAPVYGFSSVSLGTTEAVAGSLVASEQDLNEVELAASPDGLFAGPAPVPGVPEVVWVREVYPQPMPLALLRSSVSALASLGCPPASSSAAPVNGLPAWSSSLCLSPGQWVTPLSMDAVSGQWGGQALDVPVQVPADARAFLILPADAPAGAVRVLYSTVQADVPAVAQLPDADHPGSIDFWTELGTFFVPGSGVIFASETVYVGLCGVGFVAGSCQAWGQGTAGSEFLSPFTLVAGTPDSPADVVLAGPVVASSGRVGVVASGGVIVPFFAAPPASALELDLDIAVLGADATGSLISAEPTVAAGLPRGPVYFGGLVLGRALSSSRGVFDSFSWSLPASIDFVSPWLPSPELRLERVSSSRVSPVEAAELLEGRSSP